MKRTVTWGLVASGIVMAPITLWFISGVSSTNRSQQKADASSFVEDSSVINHGSKADIRELLASKTEPTTDQFINVIEAEEDPEHLAEVLFAAVQSLPESK